MCLASGSLSGPLRPGIRGGGQAHVLECSPTWLQTVAATAQVGCPMRTHSHQYACSSTSGNIPRLQFLDVCTAVLGTSLVDRYTLTEPLVAFDAIHSGVRVPAVQISHLSVNLRAPHPFGAGRPPVPHPPCVRCVRMGQEARRLRCDLSDLSALVEAVQYFESFTLYACKPISIHSHADREGRSCMRWIRCPSHLLFTPNPLTLTHFALEVESHSSPCSRAHRHSICPQCRLRRHPEREPGAEVAVRSAAITASAEELAAI